MEFSFCCHLQVWRQSQACFKKTLKCQSPTHPPSLLSALGFLQFLDVASCNTFHSFGVVLCRYGDISFAVKQPKENIYSSIFPIHQKVFFFFFSISQWNLIFFFPVLFFLSSARLSQHHATSSQVSQSNFFSSNATCEQSEAIATSLPDHLLLMGTLTSAKQHFTTPSPSPQPHWIHLNSECHELAADLGRQAENTSKYLVLSLKSALEGCREIGTKQLKFPSFLVPEILSL